MIVEKIGGGAYGEVFKAKCTKNRELRVLKIFRKQHEMKGIFEFAQEMQNL